jgi:sulfite reductase beta subunit-like hemoprotein
MIKAAILKLRGINTLSEKCGNRYGDQTERGNHQMAIPSSYQFTKINFYQKTA